MADLQDKKPQPGDAVVLTEIPPGLLTGLPLEDQRAISEMVGKTVLFSEYDEDGRAGLQFTDSDGAIHFIYVDPDVIRIAK